MVASAGAPGVRPNVSDCTGSSGSVADAVTRSSWVSTTVWLAIGVGTGGEFVSITVMLMVSEAEPPSPSFTANLIPEKVCPPSSSPGVHENTRVVGSNAAPGGSPVAEYVRVLAGRS